MEKLLIRGLDVGDWRTWRSMRQAALADAPAAFGSTLAEWSGSGDTEVRWRARLGSVAYNVLAELDGRSLGMVSATAPVGGEVVLLSLWVAPEGRGKGVGDALVTWVVERAKHLAATRVVLDVRADNAHAIALYQRHGFHDVGAVSQPDGTCAERQMAVDLSRREAVDTVPRGRRSSRSVPR